MKAYKTEIHPTKSQIRLIHQACGNVRYIYNQFIAFNFERLEKKEPVVSGYEYSKMINHDPNTLKEDVATQQFEFEEDSIDKIVEYAKNQFVGEIISDLGLGMGLSVSMESEDLEALISDVFCYGTRIGVYGMLGIYKDVIASKEEKND